MPGIAEIVAGDARFERATFGSGGLFSVRKIAIISSGC